MEGTRRLAAPQSPGRRIVGLVPAGGRAIRLAPLPCSKELYPVGYRRAADGSIRPKVASHYLIEKMQAGGATEIVFVVRRGKWDILEYYGDGRGFGVDLAYLVADEPLGPPFTLDHARPFVCDATVLFGFPDILFEPRDAFEIGLRRLDETGADVVVGAFDWSEAAQFDVVEADADGRVRRLGDPKRGLVHDGKRRSWAFAVWGPAFTAFLHEEVARLRGLAATGRAGPNPEWPVGSAIDAAIDAGLHVNSVDFPAAPYLDIGHPERLVRAANFPGVWDGRTPAVD